MGIVKKFVDILRKPETFRRLLVVVFLLLIILLYNETRPLYASIFDRVFRVFKPFVIAFMIAYVLVPLVDGLVNIGLKRTIAIIFIYSCLLVFCLFLIGVLLPAVIQSLSDLSTNLIATTRAISRILLFDYNIDITQITDVFVRSLRQLTENLSIFNNAFSTLGNALGYIGNAFIYIVLSLYILSSFDKIKIESKRITGHIHPYFPSFLSSVDYYMKAFLRGTVTLMLIRLIEYGFLFFVIGHVYWKENALLSAVCVIFPYVGPLLSAAVGILTGFSMAPVRFLVLVIMLAVLYFVDSYIVLPDVYSKETNIHPVWILFAILSGVSLFGLAGMLLAIPIFIAIRVAYLEFVFFNKERE